MAEPTQICFRTLQGVGVLNTAPVYEPLPGFERPEGNIRCSRYSPDGRFLAYASTERVVVVDAFVGHIVSVIPAANVYELAYSPLGTYLSTWQRPSKDEDGNATKNLKVWRTVEEADEQSPVGQFVQRSQGGWNLQYTSDERFCARAVTNEVQFYESGDLRTVWNKLHLEGVTDFTVSPGKNHSVACFVPERKGQPAAVKLFLVPSFAAPVSQKTFFKGDKVQMKWNQLGTGVIVLAQTEVDKSNKNYYGESTMFLLTTSGFDSRITLEKEGPIHDVAWSPNSKEFGVVYGFMPAKTTIFNSKAQATHSFALGPRNTINFSPFGRFVLVAGFGNLAGQVDVYDITKDFAKVCTIEASNASVCEWSPNATHILFATTSPRLRVDNGVKIFHVGGGLMYNADMNELYDVFWRPRSGGAPVGDPLKIVPEPHASAKEVLAKAKPPSKPAGAYRPPGARGTTTPLHFKREDEGGAAVLPTNGASGLVPGANGFGRGARRREVPGAEPVEQLPPGAAAGGGVSLTPGAEGDEGLSKAALKNKKKREARKAKEAAAERDRADGGGDAAAMPLAPPGLEGAPTGPRAMSASPDRRGGGAFNHRRNRSGYENHHARSPQRAYNQGRGGGHQQGHASPHHPQQYQGGYQGAYQGQYHQQPYPHQQQQGQYHAPQAQQYQGGYQAQYDPAAAAQAYYGAPEAAASAPDVTVTSPGGGGSSSGGGGGPPGAGVAGGGGSGGGGAAAAAAANAQSDKKLRGLLKKLRAIEDLKMRQAAGERLEATQVQKIGTEDGVRRELEALGIAD